MGRALRWKALLQKDEVLNRLKSIEGHIRAVQRMVERDAYCIDILKQTQAVQGAIDKVNLIILENHLKNCVTTAIRGQDPGQREKVLSELLQLFRGTSAVGWPRQLQAPELDDILQEVPAEKGSCDHE